MIRRAHTNLLGLPLALMIAATVMACDSGDCTSERDPSLQLGRGTGGVFVPYEDGQDVNLDVAPQGGFGVSIQAQTQGVLPGAVQLKMDSVVDGAEAGTWTIESIDLLCQEDGSGLIWGAVVGLDPARFSDNDALLNLDGELLTMIVTLTDELGGQITGQSTVTVQVGAN